MLQIWVILFVPQCWISGKELSSWKQPFGQWLVIDLQCFCSCSSSVTTFDSEITKQNPLKLSFSYFLIKCVKCSELTEISDEDCSLHLYLFWAFSSSLCLFFIFIYFLQIKRTLPHVRNSISTEPVITTCYVIHLLWHSRIQPFWGKVCCHCWRLWIYGHDITGTGDKMGKT